MLVWIAVALGGGLGALARYWLGTRLAARAGTWWLDAALAAPTGTFVINALGSFLLGLIAAYAIARPGALPGEARFFLTVGFCGGFTTYSTFSLEALTLLQRGQWWEAAIYVAATNVVVLLAVAGGFALGKLA